MMGESNDQDVGVHEDRCDAPVQRIAVFAIDPVLQFAQAVFTPLPEYDLTKVDFTAAATLLGWSQSFSLVVFLTGALGYLAVWARLGYRARS